MSRRARRSIAASADVRLALSTATGSMPARRTSRPSCSRKVRASITAATRPSPCGSKEQPAGARRERRRHSRHRSARHGKSGAMRRVMGHRLHDAALSPGLFLYAGCYQQLVFSRNCFADEGGDDGSQRHRAYFPDRVEFRTLPRVLSQAAAVSRAEAGDRHRARTSITASAAAPRSGSARRRPSMRRSASSKIASACTISASAPASAPTSTSCTPSWARSTAQNHPRAARGPVGAGILLAAVRGSGWDQAGAEPCAGEGVAGVRGSLRSR